MVVPTAQADILGFKNGGHWSANHAAIGTGDPPSFAGDSVTVTTAVGDEHNSAFYNSRQSITGFSAEFIYQAVGGADGATFCIQNDPAGTAAVGAQDGGSALGYQGIAPSVAVAFNIYSGHTGQTDILFNDGGPNVKNPGGSYVDTSPVNVASGHPIQVLLVYNATAKVLDEVLIDLATGDLFSTQYSMDIPATIGGSTAFIGFTGGTGGVSSVQTFAGFQYVEH
jgi:hypothetical protein